MENSLLAPRYVPLACLTCTKATTHSKHRLKPYTSVEIMWRTPMKKQEAWTPAMHSILSVVLLLLYMQGWSEFSNTHWRTFSGFLQSSNVLQLEHVEKLPKRAKMHKLCISYSKGYLRDFSWAILTVCSKQEGSAYSTSLWQLLTHWCSSHQLIFSHNHKRICSYQDNLWKVMLPKNITTPLKSPTLVKIFPDFLQHHNEF